MNPQYLPALKPLEILNNKNKTELPSLNQGRHQEIYQEKKQTETLAGSIITLKDDVSGKNLIEMPDNSKENISTDEFPKSLKINILILRDFFYQ